MIGRTTGIDVRTRPPVYHRGLNGVIGNTALVKIRAPFDPPIGPFSPR
jgi:hypothetical protein